MPLPESDPQQPRIEPCVREWVCVRCGRRLLLRIRVRQPGGCGHCGSLHLEPAASRPR